MPDYLSENDWKAQLKKNKLLSGTGISEGLRTLDDKRKKGTAVEYGNAINGLNATVTKAKKKFMADKTSIAYMDEISKAATKLMPEVAARGSEELLTGMIAGLEAKLPGAKAAKDKLEALRQPVRAASAAASKVAKVKDNKHSKDLAEISKDDWFNKIDDKNVGAMNKELTTAVAGVKKALEA